MTQCPILLFQCECWQCVQVSVWIKDRSLCAKTSNCSFLLPDVSSLRLLSYRHLLATLPNSSPYVIISMVQSWGAEKLVKLHQSIQIHLITDFLYVYVLSSFPVTPSVFSGPNSHRVWPKIECDFVPQEWICQKTHYWCGGAEVMGLWSHRSLEVTGELHRNL